MYAERLRALTPMQRALLARRLDREPSAETAARSGVQLVAYVEGDVASTDVQDSLRQRVPDYMVPTTVVVLDEMPRTPNGKVDRRTLPAPSQPIAVQAPKGRTPRTPVEEALLGIWSEVLHMDRIEVDDNFFEVGGDSISSIQIISRANRAGIRLKPSQFFDHPTVAGLARVAATDASESTPEAATSGEVPLTPIQRWFFEQDLPNPSHWTMSLALDVKPSADRRQLEQAIRASVRVHDAFRLRYHKTDEGWSQHLIDEASIEIQTHALPPDVLAEDAIKEIWAASQDALDLETGPLLRADLVDRGSDRSARLILTAHHLLVDVLSWQTIVSDIETAYAHLQENREPDLSAPGAPFSRWAEALMEYATSDAVAEEADLWLEMADHSVAPLPADGAGSNTERSAVTVVHRLDAEATQALSKATATYGMKVPEVMLTALALALAEWTGSPTVRIDLEGHGREDLEGLPDVSQSVGWFTSQYPVVLQPSAASPRDALIHVKETVRSLPRNGLGYGLLRYLTTAERRQRLESSDAEVLFNYMGRIPSGSETDALLGAAVELSGSRGADGTRAHLIEINSLIDDGALTFRWTYSTERHRAETLDRLIQSTRTHLDALVVHCQNPDAGAYTPSDFPDINLSQDDLDALLGDLD